MSPASPRRQRWVPLPYGQRRAVAVAERQKTVLWLRKKGKSPAALALASKLAGCRPGARCHSGACRVCTTVAQERFGKTLAWAVHGREAGQVAFTLTVATDSAATRVSDLRGFDAGNFARRLKRMLHGLPMRWAMGGLDLSLNEDTSGRYEPFWLPHAYLVGVTDDAALLKQRLKGKVGATDRVPRPLRMSILRGGRVPFLYALKHDFFRRVGGDGVRHVPSTGMLRSCRETRKQRLRSAERLEVLLFLDGLGLQKRMIGVGCQLHISGRKYRLRLTP